LETFKAIWPLVTSTMLKTQSVWVGMLYAGLALAQAHLIICNISSISRVKSLKKCLSTKL